MAENRELSFGNEKGRASGAARPSSIFLTPANDNIPPRHPWRRWGLAVAGLATLAYLLIRGSF